jgi:hypothetical protein
MQIEKKEKYKFRKKTILAGLGSGYMDIRKVPSGIKMVNVRQVTATNLKLFKLFILNLAC